MRTPIDGCQAGSGVECGVSNLYNITPRQPNAEEGKSSMETRGRGNHWRMREAVRLAKHLMKTCIRVPWQWESPFDNIDLAMIRHKIVFGGRIHRIWKCDEIEN